MGGLGSVGFGYGMLVWDLKCLRNFKFEFLTVQPSITELERVAVSQTDGERDFPDHFRVKFNSDFPRIFSQFILLLVL